MKSTFGSPLQRLLRGGVTLSGAEQSVLFALVERLPAEIRSVVEEQLDSYDLVQREVDGRSLNFYRRAAGARDLRLLETDETECPLIRLTFKIDGLAVVSHAVLTAVNRRVFCMTLSNRLDALADGAPFEVISAFESWRSGIRLRADEPNPTFQRTASPPLN